MVDISIAKSADELFQRVADYWRQLAKTALRDHGKFHVALAGGSTPRGLYRLLASNEYANQIDWQHTRFYFGDERAVPLDHEQSNFRMAREAMLDKLVIPATNIFPLLTDLDNLDNSARHYEKILRRELPVDEHDIPVIDLILLGMGDDGHTASLFPGSTILAEQSRLVAPVFVEKLQSWRLSFTYPLINHARHVAVMVSGKSKAEKLKEVLVDKTGGNPVARIQPLGELAWFVDGDAASLLPADLTKTK
ncbi:MAG: 6-phosphogluconolactonase [Gammaproteobacteria bacterium]|nr:6-phosphogluconolactonase [Gammaproteobacteria bacterium]